MWNFTGRVAVIPDFSDVKDLLACKENMTETQIDITNLQPQDTLLGENLQDFIICQIFVCFIL